MLRKVLIVDDDKIWLHVIKKKIAKYKKAFSALTAEDGLDALKKLKKNVISLVVTDMQMPRMDGLALLAHLSENYPDIPVIVVTAYSTPKSKKAVLERGAASYIEKPFEVEALVKKIMSVFKKESDGGVLQTIPLEMFIQLIEMEQKTCTIRVVNKSSGENGVLFFRNGELLDARIANMQGKLAAYEIFAWNKVTLSIQDACALKDKKIDGDLQAILFDAMRLKDEADDAEAPAVEAGPHKTPIEDTDNAEAPAVEAEPHETPIEDTEESAVEVKPHKVPIEDMVRSRLEQVTGARDVLKDIYKDSSWDDLVIQSSRIGKIFRAGALKSLYIDRRESTDYIILPGKENLTISIKPESRRDRILQALSE